jgi:thiamine pyrophosphate-dependent acetolactate synthase large subunit-like protein
MREGIHFVVLVWVDEHYGLIKWKQELEIGHPAFVEFTNPDFVKQARVTARKGTGSRPQTNSCRLFGKPWKRRRCRL